MSQICIQVSAGTGPVEVRQFTARLAKRIQCELTRATNQQGSAQGSRGRRRIVLGATQVEGDPQAPRSVTFWLHRASTSATKPGGTEQVASELDFSEWAGTHCLIHQSPTRGRKSRKRWFVGVIVRIEANTALRHTASSEPKQTRVIDPREVVFSAFRAGGSGGQHVNKTSSAVRAHHQPSGITVRVESERSQAQNRRLALRRIAAALHERGLADAAQTHQTRRLQHYQVARGDAVATWRLQPGTQTLRCVEGRFAGR